MTPAAEHFTETVESFCKWAEGKQHGLVEARQFLISLMASIPDIEESRYAGSSSEEEFPRRGYDGWKEDHQRFSDLPFQFYRVVFDAFDFDSTDEPVTGDLHDDFADIYGDLWHGLEAHRSGDTTEALALWIDSWFFHWGRHASSALNAIDTFYRQDPLGSGAAQAGD